MEKDVSTTTDIVIIGGGLAGTTLAKALSTLDLQVTLIEKRFLSRQKPGAVIDQRALALNYGSLSILKNLLGVEVSKLGNIVTDILVSDQKGFGRIALNAAKEQLPYFGCVVPIERLTEALQAEVLNDPKIKCITGECTALSQHETAVTCEVGGQNITARLVIGADGAHSKVREYLGISAQEKNYEQTALIGNVELQGIVSNTAYERFTSEGPLALLPFNNTHMTLVWVMPTRLAEMRKNLPESILLQDLQKIMGYRAGRFLAIGNLQGHKLEQVVTEATYVNRVGLLGNAAHCIHPIGGQGFNLSLRDIFGFYQTLKRYLDALDTPELIWEEYLRVRNHDQARTIKLTDSLLRGFTHKNPLIKLMRNSLMVDLELCPPAKTALNEIMVGLT